jgi:predicted nucleic acid-binding Zn ribbon protein
MKNAEEYIYPHKHCKKCGQMIEEAFTYCPDCYKKIKEKKEKKRSFFKSLFKRKNKVDSEKSEKTTQDS